MRKLFTLLFISLFFQNRSQCNYTLTTSSLNGFTITCANPTLNLMSSVTSSNGATYTWAGPSFTANTANVNITQPGTYTVISMEGVTTCTIPQVFTIGINTTVPQSSVTPITLSVICNSPATFTTIAISPTTNVQHSWLNPIVGSPPSNLSTSTATSTDLYAGTGTFTYVLTDLANGCATTQTVTVTSSQPYPTFTLSSTTNFSLGCMPINCSAISIVNPVSTQTPPATCSYTFLAPNFGGVVTPSINLGASSSTVMCTPGNVTVIVQDNSNFCRTSIEVPLNSNTIAPNVSASMISKTLTCANPTILASGLSSSANTTINWIVPSIPPFVSQPTIIIGDPSNGPPTSTIALTYANFTVVATNSLNSCQSSSVIQIHQDFRQPSSNPLTGATPTAICSPSDIVVLNSTNCFVTSAGPGASITILSWAGPSPQQTAATSNYSAYVPGAYTLDVMDSYNGCKASGTINVISNTPQFILLGVAPTSSASCDGTVNVYSQNPNTYSLSVNTGTLSGTTISHLCYGWLRVCMTNISSNCRKCDSIMINASTGLNEINFENEISVFPNPTNTDIHLKYPENKSGSIRLINVEGREIQKISLNSSGISEIKDPSVGVYLLEVNIEGTFMRRKVVVIP
jgi:hypothetical protein